MEISRRGLFKLLVALGITKADLAESELSEEFWEDEEPYDYPEVLRESPLGPQRGAVLIYDCVHECFFTDPGFLRGPFAVQAVDAEYTFDRKHRTIEDIAGKVFAPQPIKTELMEPWTAEGLKLKALHDVEWTNNGDADEFVQGVVFYRDDGRLLGYVVVVDNLARGNTLTIAMNRDALLRMWI